MPLETPAVMVLFYAFEGEPGEHDRWHSTEHFAERLALPGFRRATRYTAAGARGRYLVIYDVDATSVATSPAYLDRLDRPSEWTRAVMPRFRGMVRGFAEVVASAGLGHARHALSLRFQPDPDAGERILDAAARTMPMLAALPGMAAARLFRPAPPPPMTSEQALRGADAPLPWVLFATAFDRDALDEAARDLLTPEALASAGVSTPVTTERYLLHHSATAREL